MKTKLLFALLAALIPAAALADGADISVPGNQFAGQYVNASSIGGGLAMQSVTNNIAEDERSKSPAAFVFTDNLSNGNDGPNAQNISITAGKYRGNVFDQKTFAAIKRIRIWADTDSLTPPVRLPHQVSISYTFASLQWENHYADRDANNWPNPVFISTADGTQKNRTTVVLYDGKKINEFTGRYTGSGTTNARYVDLVVDIPAGATSIFFQFGAQGPTNQYKLGEGTQWSDLVSEIQTISVDAKENPAASQPAGPTSNIPIKSGQKIAFMGDSITQMGWDDPLGYVNEVVKGLAVNGVGVVPIPAGVSGNKSNDMLNRLDRDVLSKKPDWMTLSCGVNDVWHGASGIPLDQYEKNITAIIDKATAAGVKVVILTATVIGEDVGNGNNQKLAGYNDFLRGLAKERGLILVDLNADMQALLKTEQAKPKRPPGPLLTVDGVHMNVDGNMMMARGILRGFKLAPEQLHRAEEAWLDVPYVISNQQVKTIVTLRQYEKLEAIAGKQNKTVGDLLTGLLTKDVNQLLSAEPEAKP